MANQLISNLTPVTFEFRMSMISHLTDAYDLERFDKHCNLLVKRRSIDQKTEFLVSLILAPYKYKFSYIN